MPLFIRSGSLNNSIRIFLIYHFLVLPLCFAAKPEGSSTCLQAPLGGASAAATDLGQQVHEICDQYVAELLQREELKPILTKVIEGRTCHFSKIFDWGVKSKHYAGILMYVEEHGKLLPRLLYRSSSDGGWRATPGMRSDNTIDKGAHYVQTTKLHSAMADFLTRNEPALMGSVSREAPDLHPFIRNRMSRAHLKAQQLDTFDEESHEFKGSPELDSYFKLVRPAEFSRINHANLLYPAIDFELALQRFREVVGLPTVSLPQNFTEEQARQQIALLGPAYEAKLEQLGANQKARLERNFRNLEQILQNRKIYGTFPEHEKKYYDLSKDKARSFKFFAYVDHLNQLSKEKEPFRSFFPDLSRLKEVYPSSHTILSPVSKGKHQEDVKVYVYPALLNGREVEWHIAKHTAPDGIVRVWVDRIRFAGSGMTSYGTDQEWIDSGVITSKPVEYAEQLGVLQPFQGHAWNPLPTYVGAGFRKQYVDFTPFINRLSVIQEFLKLQESAAKISRSE